MKHDGCAFMEGVKKTNFSRPPDTKFEQASIHMLAVRHSKMLTEAFKKFKYPENFCRCGYLKLFNKLLNLLVKKFNIHVNIQTISRIGDWANPRCNQKILSLSGIFSMIMRSLKSKEPAFASTISHRA